MFGRDLFLDVIVSANQSILRREGRRNKDWNYVVKFRQEPLEFQTTYYVVSNGNGSNVWQYTGYAGASSRQEMDEGEECEGVLHDYYCASESDLHPGSCGSPL